MAKDKAGKRGEGDRPVIKPKHKRGLIALLKTMEPLEEDFPEIDDPAPAPEKLVFKRL